MPRTGKKAHPKENPAYKIYENRGTYSTLTDEIAVQIVDMARRGKINAEIITILGVPDDTFYSWHARNTKEIKDKLAEARRAYLLDIAEEGLTQLANSKSERIRLDALRFLTERLGKRWYATRSENVQLEENEGAELEPENKAKLERLLTPKPIAVADSPADPVQTLPVTVPTTPEKPAILSPFNG